MAESKHVPQRPTGAFIGASWCALIIGVSSYLVGLWNATSMELNEKGYYFTILLFGLFAVISIQKTIRDRAEDIPVTNIYYGVAWFSVVASISLLVIGLWNADMLLSEKGFYGLAMLMSLFGAITVQKNVRDMAAFAEVEKTENPKRKLFSGQDDSAATLGSNTRATSTPIPGRPE
ncbi:inner membrane protein YiaA [Arthrobacter sp. Ld5]|uniref:inner membrane protein YiaA n=1 Tax=Arthrobacter sp. Ld5 TaxID=649152 RepID=UPI003EBEEB43